MTVATEPLSPPYWLTEPDAVAAWKRWPRFRQEQIAQSAEMCYQRALAYVWGRQDAGEGERDTGVAIIFAEHRRREMVRFHLELTHCLAPLQRSFEEWQR